MTLFRQGHRPDLLHALTAELLKHQDNLQRALDGKSAFYLPTPAQRDNIYAEQHRLISMLAGVDALYKYGQEHTGGTIAHELTIHNYHALRFTAGTAYLQVTHCHLDDAHPAILPDQQQGLLDLFIYFDAKMDATDLMNKAYYTYDTLHAAVGYTQHTR